MIVFYEEVEKRWGKDTLQDTENRVRKMGKEGLAAAKAQGLAINEKLAQFKERLLFP